MCYAYGATCGRRPFRAPGKAKRSAAKTTAANKRSSKAAEQTDAKSTEVKRPKTASDAPRAVPAPRALFPELPPTAVASTIYTWQWLRCMADELTIDENVPVWDSTIQSS